MLLGTIAWDRLHNEEDGPFGFAVSGARTDDGHPNRTAPRSDAGRGSSTNIANTTTYFCSVVKALSAV